MTKAILGLGVFLMLTASEAMAHSGSIAGNGADSSLSLKSQAWFLGARPIQWCVVWSTQSALYTDPKSTVRSIESAFDTWRNYLRVKQVRNDWPAEVPFPELKQQFHSKCEPDTDLIFAIGVQSGETEPYRKQYLDPRGFAQLLSYDSKEGWGRGFIWIRGNDQKARQFAKVQEFQALVTHELGHVLGISHVDGTLMRADLSDVLEGKSFLTPLERAHFHELIDQTRELFFARDSGVRTMMIVASELSDPTKKVFEFVTGRSALAPVNMVFVQGEKKDRFRAKIAFGDYTGDSLSSPKVIPGWWVEDGEPLVITHRLVSSTFEVEMFSETLLEFKTSDAFVFRSFYQGKERKLDVPGYLIQGRVLLPGRAALPITYYRNRGEGEVLRLIATIDGVPHLFYRAELSQQSIR